MEDKGVTINNKYFEHIKTREYVPISVFRNGDLYLRKGPQNILWPELDFHKNLLQYGFPVPEIVETGEIEDDVYFIETSLGEDLLGDLFWEDTKKDGVISQKHFKAQLELAKKFTHAQLNTIQAERNEESFYKGVHIDYILAELPELKNDVLTAFNKTKERTKVLPFVFTHGDFNAYNLFEKGVIDFGSAFSAPAGYDLVSAICHTYFFPKDKSFEIPRRYEFSEAQINEYFETVDNIYKASNLPKLSEFTNDFIFCRSVWATVRMERTPKLQQWRYAKFKQILQFYLEDKLLLDALKI